MAQTQNSINFAATTGTQQFIINPPTPYTVGPNQLDVNGAVSIGSYAGLDTAPANGLIVSGLFGIGTPILSAPNYQLEVNGSINATRVYSSASAIDNQIITLAIGYNQGGFGGGSVGTISPLGGSITTYVAFDLQANVNSSSDGFQGGVFDGRYIYLAPAGAAGAALQGLITRYDTTGNFTASVSYAFFDTQANVNSNSRLFDGAVFDGRYVYFVPSTLGQITCYDTTISFTASASYAVFNTASLAANSVGFSGAVFDGRYVYFVPNNFGIITRYDTTGSFTANTSYATFDLQAKVISNSSGFQGGAFDGRYVYFVPDNNGSIFGQITRYDTTGSFSASVSYSTFDMQANVNSNSAGFYGAVFDGRYVYFITSELTLSSGQWTRYDTTGSFTVSTSYSVFNLAGSVNSRGRGFIGGVFDGRYIYLVPSNNGANSGSIINYDTTQSFTSSTAYSVYNTQIATISSNSAGFHGGLFDGRYVYFIPNAFGVFLKFVGYPGPQATAIAASQSASGFAVGTYAGITQPPANGLIVSGQVGVVTPSPAYSLDVYGSINALRVYSSASTINNQNIALAEGYNQGGFGGGSVGTVKVMAGSTTTALFFDTQAQVNSNLNNFYGAVFDGRFLYFVPSGANQGVVMRFDTTQSFSTSTSYLTIDTQANVNSNSRGFRGGIYDGR